MVKVLTPEGGFHHLFTYTPGTTAVERIGMFEVGKELERQSFLVATCECEYMEEEDE